MVAVCVAKSSSGVIVTLCFYADSQNTSGQCDGGGIVWRGAAELG